MNKFISLLISFQTLKVNAILDGTGVLHVPSVPDFKGKDLFKGDAFHPARWKRDYDPTGKRIAVIGTGSTGIQLIPEIALQV